jgi:signal transduction histidine kinase
MVMPLTTGDEVLGVLFAGWRRDSPHAAAAQEETTEVQTVAALAALALQRVRAQDDRERVHLLEDREQIAYKLHDAVLQRLFAVGLRLHSATAVSTEPPVQHRLRQAIDDLEATTDQVRWTIERLSGDGEDGVPFDWRDIDSQPRHIDSQPVDGRDTDSQPRHIDSQPVDGRDING